MAITRRGPYAAGSALNKKFARKVGLNMRLKEDVIEFLKIGGSYHGVGFETYMQWLLERALLEEIRYYGWGSDRAISFDQQHPQNHDEHREFLHLNNIARLRKRETNPDDSDDPPQT